VNLVRQQFLSSTRFARISTVASAAATSSTCFSMVRKARLRPMMLPNANAASTSSCR
jgi:hypothetical protein